MLESSKPKGTPCAQAAAEQSESQLELALQCRRVEIVVARGTEYPLSAWVVGDGRLIYFRIFRGPERTPVETFISETRLWLSSRAPRLDIDVVERLQSLMPLPCPPPPPDDIAAIEAVVNVIRTSPDA